MITNLIDGEKVKVYGDGLYVRDWLFVREHARAIEAILESGAEGTTYLVGGMSEDINNLGVAKLILAELFSFKFPLIHLNFPGLQFGSWLFLTAADNILGL